MKRKFSKQLVFLQDYPIYTSDIYICLSISISIYKIHNMYIYICMYNICPSKNKFVAFLLERHIPSKNKALKKLSHEKYLALVILVF